MRLAIIFDDHVEGMTAIIVCIRLFRFKNLEFSKLFPNPTYIDGRQVTGKDCKRCIVEIMAKSGVQILAQTIQIFRGQISGELQELISVEHRADAGVNQVGAGLASVDQQLKVGAVFQLNLVRFIIRIVPISGIVKHFLGGHFVSLLCGVGDSEANYLRRQVLDIQLKSIDMLLQLGQLLGVWFNLQLGLDASLHLLDRLDRVPVLCRIEETEWCVGNSSFGRCVVTQIGQTFLSRVAGTFVDHGTI